MNDNSIVNRYNPETNTIDYDPGNLPDADPEVGYRTVGVARIGIELRLPDGDTKNVNPDDYMSKVVVEQLDHTVKTISGRLRAVCGSSRYQNFMPRFYNPMGPQLSDYVLPQMLVIDTSEQHKFKLEYVPIMSIQSIDEIKSAQIIDGTIVGPGNQYAPLDTVITNAKEGDIIELLSGDYDANLVINKSLTIMTRGRATLSGSITVGVAGDEKDLEFKLIGMDLTKDATINVNHATSFIMTNCEVYGVNAGANGALVLFNEQNELHLEISECTFQQCTARNVIYVNPYLTEDSRIDNNRFEEGCCTGDTIVLKGLARNGDIQVLDNYCYRSMNLVRISFRGESNGRILLRGNQYSFTDPATAYAGIVCIEPDGQDFVSMLMLDISISDTTNTSGISQLVYLFSDVGDAIFTSATKPCIYIDGYFKEIPYIIVDANDQTTTYFSADLTENGLPNDNPVVIDEPLPNDPGCPADPSTGKPHEPGDVVFGD